MTRRLFIDIETFSSVDLSKSGVYKYVESPDFEVLLFAYAFDDEPVQLVDLASGEALPQHVVGALQDPTIIKYAYNAQFERVCLGKCWNLPVDQWRCTMVHGLYLGYPAGLAVLAEALGLPQEKQKLRTGSTLIKTFCAPCRATRTNGMRTRTLPRHEPEKWQLFKEYCIRDVEVEREIENRLAAFPVPTKEQTLWEIDQTINDRGVMVDEVLVKSAVYLDRKITTDLTNEAREITGLENPNSVKQLKAWFEQELGCEIADLQKTTVTTMLESDTNSNVRRMLEIRRALAKTSRSKYTAMRETLCEDNRIRGLLQFYGANRTGRWAGRLVQVQNLPRNYLEALTHARNCVKAKKIDALKIIYGNVPDTLSQLIRTAFIPSPGNVLVVADFSAIEARVVAWLAGEQWRMDVFATHGKMYEASASVMFGVPIEEIGQGSDLRQKGKVSELALGYQGSVGALKRMGALEMGLTEEELPEIVQRWRTANKRIVDLWYGMENAALEVMRTGQPVCVRGLILAREGDYQNQQDFFTITLPSGRKLFYAKPFLAQNDFGKESLHYYTVGQNTRKWEVTSTYGGKLVENVTQAIARDCLAESIIRLHQAGYQIIVHVHDEVVLDVPKEQADLDKVCDIMGQPIPWAPGLLLKADGFITDFYMKD